MMATVAASAKNKASPTASDGGAVQQQPRKSQPKKNTNVHNINSKNRKNSNPNPNNNNGKNRYKHHNNNNNNNGGRHYHGRHHHRNSGKLHNNTDSTNKSKKQVPHNELTTSLLEVSTTRNLIESSEGLQNRRRVMQRLDEMLCAWSDSLLPPLSYAEKLSLSTSSSSSSSSSNNNRRNQQQPSLLSFGSYRLGVHNPNADIDCLVLAPPHVQRTDFFDSWITVLKNHQQQQSSSSNESKSSSIITDIHPVSTAYTPVVKFCMNGIKIDMIFARLTNAQLNWLNECRLVRLQQQQQQGIVDAQPQKQPLDGNDDGTEQQQQLTILQEVTEMQVNDDILLGLDETSARSVNGVRVSQYLLRCVGSGERLDNFRLTLRIVKEWARVHGLYSNVLGFLGGVNWAILVCWVCKENPTAKPSMLLKAFFRTFANWSWPHPVLLSKQQTRPMKGVTSHPIWDPVNNFRDSKHLMPIITPCYPSMNSSYNVGEPQLRRIQDELRRATKISNDVCFGRKTWSDLFKGNDFFRQHANYLQVDISSSNEDEFREWFGLCEARMRILIAGLENPSYGTQAYPFAKFFTRKEDDDDDEKEDGGKGKYVSSFFIAIRFAEYAQTVDLGPLVMEYLHIVNSWEKRTATMDLKMNLVLQENLPSFAFEVEECAEKENEANDTDSTATETPTKSIGEQEEEEEEEEAASTLNAEATDSVHENDVATSGAKKTIEHQATPAPTKKKLDDSATPSIFISPLKRAKIG